MLKSVALQYRRWRKSIARSLFQDGVLRAASMLHATSEDEASSYRDLGFRNRIEIIPLGMDVLPRVNTDQARAGRRALFLGRLHYVKGIDWLVDAWIRLESDFPDWELSVVGPLEPSYMLEIERMKLATSGKRVSFIGPLYGDEKQSYLANSELFILPSRSENFGLTVLESLMMEVPVIATKGMPWSGLVTADAGWWIDPGPLALEDAMRNAMLMPNSSLRRMGKNGRLWAEADFSWSAIGAKWQGIYEKLM
jgi:glycosyltransferase involved in cell wall biosynthesis